MRGVSVADVSHRWQRGDVSNNEDRKAFAFCCMLMYHEVTALGGLLVKTPPTVVGGRFSFAQHC